jgi:hypothetical protein
MARLLAAPVAAARAALALLIAILLVLLRWTWRVRVHGTWPRGAVLWACWHGDLIALLAAPVVPRPTVLVSRSRDGSLAALVARLLGYGVVRGSSSRGAVAGARGLVHTLRAGGSAALAVDGPRGPRERASSTATRLAALAGVRLLPLAARARPALRFGSWDRMILPLPFARVEIGRGEPDADPLQGSLDALRSRLSAAVGAILLALTLLGCEPGGERVRRALASQDPAQRCEAIERLAESRERAAVELVVPHLKDPSPRVRRAAVAAVATLGGARAQLGRLLDRLQDGDLEVRIATARALGDSGDARARPGLVSALEDRSPVVRRAASAALAALGVTPSGQAAALAAQRLAAEIARLQHPDEQIRASAARELGLAEQADAVAPLIRALDGTSPLVAREAARALGRIGSAEARRILLARAGRKEHRAQAALGVALLEGEPAARSLLGLLMDPSSEARAAALTALAEEGARPPSGELARAVCRELASPAPDLALAAARILGARGLRCPTELAGILKRDPGDERAFALLAATGDPASTTALLAGARRRYLAHRESAIAWIPANRWHELDGEEGSVDPSPDPGPPPKGDKTRGDPGKRPALERILRRFPAPIPEEEAEPLIPASVPVAAVVGAIRVIGERAGDDAVRDWLAEVALEAPPQIRAAALSALAGARRPTSQPVPQATTRPAEPADPAGRAVWAGLRSDRVEVRRAAATSCPLLGPGAAAAASTLLRERDFELRQAGARCVGELRLASEVPRLLELLAEDRSSALIRALGAVADRRALPAFEALLREEPSSADLGSEERALTIWALGELADPGAAASLERELGHPDWRVRLAAARALTRAPRRTSRDALEVCRADFVAEVRRACTAGLRALPR